MEQHMKYSLLAAGAALAMVLTAAQAGPVQSLQGVNGLQPNLHPLIDITPPVLVSTLPSTGAVGVPVNAFLRLTFNENIKAGSGGFDIHRVVGEGLVVRLVLPNPRVTIAGKSVTLNPNGYLAHHTAYYVGMTPGTVTDMAGNGAVGITNTTTFRFTTN
jgi:hypothetical protein